MTFQSKTREEIILGLYKIRAMLCGYRPPDPENYPIENTWFCDCKYGATGKGEQTGCPEVISAIEFLGYQSALSDDVELGQLMLVCADKSEEAGKGALAASLRAMAVNLASYGDKNISAADLLDKVSEMVEFGSDKAVLKHQAKRLARTGRIF